MDVVNNWPRTVNKKGRPESGTAKEGTCQIVKSLPISLYIQTINGLHRLRPGCNRQPVPIYLLLLM